MARKIGYAIGLELASQRSKSEFQDIRSELSAVFRRLHLGKVILREWEPVVFVTCPDSKTESLESAFGQGVLEGVVHARSSEPVFVKHSIPRSTPREGTRFGYRKKNRSNWK